MKVEEVKNNFGKHITWKNNKYLLVGYCLRYNPDKKEIYRQLELLDENKNSIVVVALESININVQKV